MFTRLSPGGGAPVTVTREGVRLPRGLRGPVDLLVDGHRVWSFDPRRDARLGAQGRLVPWPPRLAPYLVGSAQVRLTPHLEGATVYDARVAFTDDDREVAVVDRLGHRLSIDKGGRLQRTFDRTDDDLRGLIVERTDTVIAQLREDAGLEAFLAFGCLLGAVRDGAMIGHDCDADVAYLSRHEHPLDIVRESRAAATVMQRLGHHVVRMSDADFKVWLPLPDGRRCGIDVFAGYHHDGVFHLLPSVRGTLTREDLLPVGTVCLEGRELVAPARPEALLAASYGPGWRTPDPSFKFTPDPDLLRHMDDYWRGSRQGTWHWTEFYDSPAADLVPGEPSDFARWVHEHLAADDALVEVGSGTGRDAAWYAARGHDVVASDSAHRARGRTRQAHRRAVRRAERRAERQGHGSPAHGSLEVRLVNLNDVRTTLREATRLAFDPVSRHVCARLVLDDLDAQARHELYRFADLVTRRGGSTFLEVRARGGVGAARLRTEITAYGGAIVAERSGTGDGLPPDPSRTHPTRRWIVRWRPTPHHDQGDTP